MTRTSIVHRRRSRRPAPPRGARARSGAWAGGAAGRLPSSSRNSVPPLRRLEPADPVARSAPVNAPFRCPNSSLGSSGLGDRAEVDRHEHAGSRAPTQPVQLARDRAPCRCRSRRGSARWRRSAPPWRPAGAPGFIAGDVAEDEVRGPAGARRRARWFWRVSCDASERRAGARRRRARSRSASRSARASRRSRTRRCLIASTAVSIAEYAVISTTTAVRVRLEDPRQPRPGPRAPSWAPIAKFMSSSTASNGVFGHRARGSAPAGGW